ncbi:MAG: glycosyltransferase [Alphaproteobacteria bacterium]|nr:glycosyltransferase [Alphaproteobacteria bacterium]
MSKTAQKTNDLRDRFDDVSRLVQAGNLKLANVKVESALAEYPDNINFLHLGGIIKQNIGEIELADKLLRTAHALRPDQPDIMHNLAVFLLATNQPIDAVPLYEQLVQLAPTRAHLWANYGHALRQSGMLVQSIPAFEKAQELDPKNHDMDAVIAMTRRQMADWSGPALPLDKIPANLAPIFIDDPFKHLECVKKGAGSIKPVAQFDARGLPQASRMRIGYLSNDLHEHATSYLLAELFGHHDRAQFEVFVYSYGQNGDNAVRTRMQCGAEHWVNCAGMPPVAIAERIFNDRITILVDLKGYTRGGLPEVLAARPAPIIIQWLGYPGSMGAPFVDYIIADEVIIPQELSAAYSEKIIRLPHSYQINDRERPLLVAKPREAYGLPNDALVLCCFNQTYKITPQVFDIWMHILKDEPRAVLWLFAPHAIVQENLRKEAEKRDVAAERLVFAEKLPQAEHIARYRHADLVLDTAPYGGHTTTSDALWVGAPVVALCGKSFASRVAASLLKAAELPELIASSLDIYETKIRELIKDEPKRASIRQHLQQERERLPLFDSAGFVKDLEKAYQAAWQDKQ